jgi:hypothetical protein
MVFIFSSCYPSILGDQKWKLFISECCDDLQNESDVKIDNIVLESIMIQYVYKHYLQIKNNNKNVKIDKEVIPIENTVYWKVCTLEYCGIKYLYHKDTKYVFLNDNSSIVWKGTYDENKKIIIERNDVVNNKNIEEWLNKCGIIINKE